MIVGECNWNTPNKIQWWARLDIGMVTVQQEECECIDERELLHPSDAGKNDGHKAHKQGIQMMVTGHTNRVYTYHDRIRNVVMCLVDCFITEHINHMCEAEEDNLSLISVHINKLGLKYRLKV
jgi:hypothetical protein